MGEFVELPDRVLRRAARRSAATTSSARSWPPATRGRAHRGGGLRHRRAPDRRGARDDGRPDRQRGREPARASRGSSARLRDDPTLLPAAVEETLRYEGPVERSLNRWAATDVELGGQTIRRGELVIPILDAADRDPPVSRIPTGSTSARGHASPRVRARQPLLPRRAAGASRGRDRAGDALPAPARASARRAPRRARVARDPRVSARSWRCRSPGKP